jgi:hypothetical protein
MNEKAVTILRECSAIPGCSGRSCPYGHDTARGVNRSAMKVEPLLNPDLEKKRITYALMNLMNAPEASEIGIGDLKDDRLTRSIAVIALKSRPAAGDVFNRSFLPSKAERTISIKTN